LRTIAAKPQSSRVEQGRESSKAVLCLAFKFAFPGPGSISTSKFARSPVGN
jgi:hypothetical protein